MHDAEGITRPLAHAHDSSPTSSSSSNNSPLQQLKAPSPSSQPTEQPLAIGIPPLPNLLPKYRRHRPPPLNLNSLTNNNSTLLPKSPNPLLRSPNIYHASSPLSTNSSSQNHQRLHAPPPTPNQSVVVQPQPTNSQEPPLQWLKFVPQLSQQQHLPRHQHFPPPHAMMPPLPPNFQNNNMVPQPLPYFQYTPFPYSHTLPQNNSMGPGIISRTWSTGLLDRFSDIKNCILTIWCPCVTFGQVSEILTEGHIKWWESTFVYTGLFCFSMFFSITYRIKMRKKFSLEGDLCSDFFTTMICQCCVLCQMYRQLDSMGYNVALGWEANKEKEYGREMQPAFQVPPSVDPGMAR